MRSAVFFCAALALAMLCPSQATSAPGEDKSMAAMPDGLHGYSTCENDGLWTGRMLWAFVADCRQRHTSTSADAPLPAEVWPGETLEELCGSNYTDYDTATEFYGPLQYLEIPDVIVAYYRFGNASSELVPVVMVMGFSGTMKGWPISVLADLAEDREVIIFDNRGQGFSTVRRLGGVGGLCSVPVSSLPQGRHDVSEADWLYFRPAQSWTIPNYDAGHQPRRAPEHPLNGQRHQELC